MKEIIKLKLVQVDESGFHLLMPCRLSDNTEYYLILDSGASNTVLDQVQLTNYIKPGNRDDYYSENEYKNKLNNSKGITNQELHFSFGKLELLKLGNLEIHGAVYPFLNLEHIAFIYSELGIKNVIGIWGCDYLLKTNAVINFKERTLSMDFNPNDFK